MIRSVFLCLLLLLFILPACDTPGVQDKLLNEKCGAYSIAYDSTYGLFIVTHDKRMDTISLQENWAMALYRYRQCSGSVAGDMTYDAFLKSDWYCLPGSETWHKMLDASPQAVFTSADAPRLCDCIDAQGNYDSGNPNCEAKFQVFRSTYSDSLSWYFSFYRDRCRGTVADSVGFTMWQDSLLSQAERAERLERRRRFVQDSLEGTPVARQCSGSSYLAPHQRSSSMRMYEQCRAMTRHRSGRCGKHR